MRKTSIGRFMGAATLAVASLTACVSDGGLDKDRIAEICKEYCDERPARAPSVYQLLKPTRLGGQTVNVPMGDLYLLDGDRGLVTPLDTTYGTPRGDAPPPLDKSQGLDPRCFSRVPYTPIQLGTIDLDWDNTTITLVNLDRDGRLESRLLDRGDDMFPQIDALLTNAPSSGTGPEYLEIQDLLTRMARPTTDSLFMQNVSIPRRDLVGDDVPPEKTPFYKDLTTTNFSDLEGHVFFYVLLDQHLEFARDHAALVTYAPNAQAGLGTFYTPFVQYDVMPLKPDPARLDVMVFHFIRDEMFKIPKDLECRYVYDKQVISRGQTPFPNSTPIKIDPEIKSKGVTLPPSDDGE